MRIIRVKGESYMRKVLLLSSVFFFAFGAPKLCEAIELVPGGENVVFEMKTNGIIVTGTYDVKTGNSIYNPSKHSDINEGDMIIGIENYRVSNLYDFISHFNEFTNNQEVEITITRKGKTDHKKLRLISVNGDIKTGLYVKERVLGIGTMSFYDPINKIYGALGHEVTDSSTKEIVEIKSGAIYNGNVIGINKGQNGAPGDKMSEVSLEDAIGTIEANTSFGIFGSIEEIPSTYVPIKMATHDEVKLGKAEIQTVTKGSKVETYQIEITNLKKQETSATKGITFKVTDPKLLAISNGIYSGMSGSPIIQNNMLVGAVTHVIVDDIQMGYGVYMEYMYQNALQYF